jgi:hypothetical protein
MFLPLLIRMHPNVGRNLPLLGQPDHVHGRCILPLPARSALQRGLELPDRRIPRAPERLQRNTGLGLAPMALDLEEAITAVEALGDRRRRLGGATKAIHAK